MSSFSQVSKAAYHWLCRAPFAVFPCFCSLTTIFSCLPSWECNANTPPQSLACICPWQLVRGRAKHEVVAAATAHDPEGTHFQGPVQPYSALVFLSLLLQFFACLVMIAYGVSTFFSFQAWRGVGSNAATSQMAGGYA